MILLLILTTILLVILFIVPTLVPTPRARSPLSGIIIGNPLFLFSASKDAPQLRRTDSSRNSGRQQFVVHGLYLVLTRLSFKMNIMF